MLKLTTFLKATSSRALKPTASAHSNAYAINNIAETRKLQQLECARSPGIGDRENGEKYLNIAKKSLIASDKFPVTVRYNNITPTDDKVIYVIHHLNELGYTISDVREVVEYDGAGWPIPSATVVKISLPARWWCYFEWMQL